MDPVNLITGDCLAVLKGLPAGSVNCCVTSPPYWNLRDYQIEGQLGLESTPAEYVAHLVAVFREVRRVLRDDGTLWLVLGDCFNAAGCKGHGTRVGYKQGTNRASAAGTDTCRSSALDLKPKDLVGIPWRVAFALQADGWYLRSDIIYAKSNPMPESVIDRPTKSHEYLFLLAKSENYYYDAAAIKEPAGEPRVCGKNSHANVDRDLAHGTKKQDAVARRTYLGFNERYYGGQQPITRNRRDVWLVASSFYKGAHFATFPEKLVEPCVLAGCPEGGVVLDPFFGAGTTGVVAQRLGRRYLGIELNPEYITLAQNRIKESAMSKGKKRNPVKVEEQSNSQAVENPVDNQEPVVDEHQMPLFPEEGKPAVMKEPEVLQPPVPCPPGAWEVVIPIPAALRKEFGGRAELKMFMGIDWARNEASMPAFADNKGELAYDPEIEDVR